MSPWLVLLLAVGDTRLELPPQEVGPATARATLRIAESGPGPGLGRVWLALEVEGPAGLEVEGPRLEDALAGWRTPQAFASWALSDGRAVWALTLRLDQVKPGAVPLPGVVLRVRSAPEGPWHEVNWPDLLHEARDVGGVEPPPPVPPSPWPERLLLSGLGLVVLVALCVLVRVGRLWRVPAGRSAPAEERACARLATAGTDPAGQLAEVLRAYTAERFAVEARPRTTAELVRALEGKRPGLGETVGELLAWCDEIKFAGRAPSAGEVEAAYERARRFIATTAAGFEQGGKSEQLGASGEKRTSEQER